MNYTEKTEESRVTLRHRLSDMSFADIIDYIASDISAETRMCVIAADINAYADDIACGSSVTLNHILDAVDRVCDHFMLFGYSLDRIRYKAIIREVAFR